ncbi:MAG: glycosyltransferase [Methylobacter sp.]
MRISLVINTYNRMHTLPSTLQSLEFLRYPALEVIVVDGPSSDGTMEYLQTNWHDKVKIYTCDEANLSKSRNIGIKNASGDIVCFTDDDGIPEPDWLNQLVIAYDNTNVGAAGGWVRNHTGVEYQTKHIVSSRNSTSEVQINDLSDIPESKPYTDKFPGLIGVNSSFRRSALIEVGGFDEEYAYFLDETDVLARMVDAGYKVKIIPNAEVHHKYAPSHIRATNGVARSWLQIMTSTAYYIIKNALPSAKLSWCMETIASHKNNLTNHTNWFLSQKIIDDARHAQLITEIEQGADKGISDAFEYTQRQLISSHHVETIWKDFPRLLPHEERLRLAFVTALYPPRPCGGVAVFINNLAKQLAELGHEITVITQSDTGRGHTVDFEDGVWVHRLPDEDTMICESPSNMPDMPEHQKKIAGRVLAELNRVNDRRKFQYVVGTIWDLDLAAVIASKKFPTAMYLVTSYKLMEDSKPEWKDNRDFYNNHFAKMVCAERWALENVNHVLASTHAILRDTENAYQFEIDRERLEVLPFGVPYPPDFSEFVHNEKNEVDLLFVGRLEHRKGIDLILQALPDFMMKNHLIRFTCIGDNTIPSDDGRTYVEKFLEEFGSCGWINRVQFLGHVDDETLERAYANCDVFVAPSRYESFGLIYLEAMRYGKPCIGTTAGGIPEVVNNEVTGLLASPGDVTTLCRAIERLLNDSELRNRMGGAGRQRYLEKFTTEQFASNIEALIRRWTN